MELQGAHSRGHMLVYLLTACCLALSILTSSFDIFLVLQVGPFNFRISQLLLLFPMMLAVCVVALRQWRCRVPVGFIWLCLWSGFILAFVPNTVFLARSVGYAFWLVFDMAMILMFVQLVTSWHQLRFLIRVYLYTFGFVALFGLLQFAMGVLGMNPPLVTQWWLPRLPRVNGFCYEPSFYSTYMLMGWVLSFHLWRTGTAILSRRQLMWIFFCTTGALLLSGSRMGWIMMALWLLQYPAGVCWGLARGVVSRARLRTTLLLGAGGLLVAMIVLSIVSLGDMEFLLSGLGVGGSASHSAGTRTREFGDTITLFVESPFVGRSLGGISSAIGALRGVDVTNIEAAKENEGMNVFAEVLAASGFFGFIPFVLFVYGLLRKPLLLVRNSTGLLEEDLRHLVTGMMWSLLFEFAILQFNQNILRPYLWMHIALLCTTYAVARQQVCRLPPEQNSARECLPFEHGIR